MATYSDTYVAIQIRKTEEDPPLPIELGLSDLGLTSDIRLEHDGGGRWASHWGASAVSTVA